MTAAIDFIRGQELASPYELEMVPAGHSILDGGLVATKTAGGSWRYASGEHWEPDHFPCVYIGPETLISFEDQGVSGGV